jgi:hypothetical protein
VDEITLTLPRRRGLYRVAHLVVGGLAVRLDLTFEHLEDLQLALAGILDRQEDDGEITVSLRVEGDSIHASVGPFEGHRMRSELESASDGRLDLRRLLETVCDDVRVVDSDAGEWIEFTKSIAAVPS